MTDLPDVGGVPAYDQAWGSDLDRLQWERAVAAVFSGDGTPLILRDTTGQERVRIQLFSDLFDDSGVDIRVTRADGTVGASLALFGEGDVDIYTFDWTGNTLASQIELEQNGRVFNFGGSSPYERGLLTGSQDPNSYTPGSNVWHVEFADGPAAAGGYQLRIGTAILEGGGSIAFDDDDTAIEAYFLADGHAVAVTGDATSFDVELDAGEYRPLRLATSTLDAGDVVTSAVTIGDIMQLPSSAGSLYSRNNAGVGELWVKVAEEGMGADWEKVTTT